MQNLLLFLLFFLPATLTDQQTSAPQNPCRQQETSQRQMEDCADLEYRQADAHLNGVYSKAMQYMTHDLARTQKAGDETQVKYEQAGIDNLKKAEREWLSYRDVQCKAAGQLYEGGSMSPMIYSKCLRALTEHRIVDLKTVYENGDQKLD
jgi:uncharacterized protein YecT (DUF1311 family)